MDTTFLFIITIAFIFISSTIVLALSIYIPKTMLAPTEDEERSLTKPTADPFDSYIEYTLFGF